MRRRELHGAPLPADLRGDPCAGLQLGAPGLVADGARILGDARGDRDADDQEEVTRQRFGMEVESRSSTSCPSSAQQPGRASAAAAQSG